MQPILLLEEGIGEGGEGRGMYDTCASRKGGLSSRRVLTPSADRASERSYQPPSADRAARRVVVPRTRSGAALLPPRTRTTRVVVSLTLVRLRRADERTDERTNARTRDLGRLEFDDAPCDAIAGGDRGNGNGNGVVVGPV